MLKTKKGLVNIIENYDNNNEPEEAPPRPSQTPQHIQTQVAQPPASAPRQVGDQIGWEEHLIQALAKAPEDMAQKLATCIDREVLLKVLQRRDDPLLKVALLLLTKK
jgi:hypothetical protein